MKTHIELFTSIFAATALYLSCSISVAYGDDCNPNSYSNFKSSAANIIITDIKFKNLTQYKLCELITKEQVTKNAEKVITKKAASNTNSKCKEGKPFQLAQYNTKKKFSGDHTSYFSMGDQKLCKIDFKYTYNLIMVGNVGACFTE